MAAESGPSGLLLKSKIGACYGSERKENETETDITTRKWEDGKGRQLVKGVFTSDEEKKVIDAICEYVLHGHMMDRRHGDVRDETQ